MLSEAYPASDSSAKMVGGDLCHEILRPGKPELRMTLCLTQPEFSEFLELFNAMRAFR